MSDYGQMIPTLKSGHEKLKSANLELNCSLLDFWRWSASDVLSNATRGKFAEFIVAKACGINTQIPRDEWGAYDLTTPKGIKIEVKSAAYIQSWHQERLSGINFSIKKTRAWDSVTNTQSENKTRHVDIYVFCLLAHKDQETIDPLDLRQWEFYVLAVTEVNNYQRSQSSITLPSLVKLTSPVTFSELHSEIMKKNQINLHANN